jgi:porphobilinogen synthase
MAFPAQRPRRLRASDRMRDLVRETRLSPHDFILPLFVSSLPDSDRPIAALPGCRALSGEPLARFARSIRDHEVPAVLLFAIAEPDQKDLRASAASRPDGPVQQALAVLKETAPELVAIADLCLCEYKSDGHCGVLANGRIDNDATLERIGEIGASFAAAGADVIAPSGMMDGMVAAIRGALDGEGLSQTAVMPYSAKFASELYGPFKAGTDSNPEVGLHATHQMDVANGREAMREIALDLEEGADMIIIKPALTCLDVIREARNRFNVPIAAYHVSGESAMIRAAAQAGSLDAGRMTREALLSIKRAGADMIITYSALEVIETL